MLVTIEVRGEKDMDGTIIRVASKALELSLIGSYDPEILDFRLQNASLPSPPEVLQLTSYLCTPQRQHPRHPDTLNTTYYCSAGSFSNSITSTLARMQDKVLLQKTVPYPERIMVGCLFKSSTLDPVDASELW